MNSLRSLSFSILFILLLISCGSHETKESNNPVFYSNSSEFIYDKLQNTMLPEEQLKFNGYTITKDGDVTKELAIYLFNAERLPQDDNELKNVGIKLAKATQLILRDKNQYNSYKVIFVTRPQNYDGRTDTSFITLKPKDF